MITFRNFQNLHVVANPGRARKTQSDQIMLNTWWQDIQAQTCYIYDYYHDQKSDEALKLNDLHPEDDPQKTALPIKFIRHIKQTYDKDQITFWLQMQPGQTCNQDYYEEVLGKRYDTLFPIGNYVDIMHEDGTYNKWLIVDKANYNGNQFPTFEILRCDFVAQWIFNGHKYQCPAVLRSQNSYNSGLWLDLNKVPHISNNMWKNLLNCWELLRVSILQHKDEICLCVNVLKNTELDNQQPSLDEGKVQRLCGASASSGRDLLKIMIQSELMRKYKKSCLYYNVLKTGQGVATLLCAFNTKITVFLFLSFEGRLKMSKKYILSKEQLNEMQLLLNQKMSYNQIGKIYHMSGQSVSRIVSDNNLIREYTNSEIMQFRLPGHEEIEKLVCDYYCSHDIGMKDVGNIFDIGTICVENILIRNNIDRKNPADFIRKYHVQEDYFANIDTDEKAYILGFLYADGCMVSNSNRLQLSLQEEDVDILNKINMEFNSDRRLKYILLPKKYPNRKQQYLLVIENKTFYDNLLYQGLVPNKSYVAKFPEHIKECFYKPFIRGLYDGDGCLYHNTKQNSNTISITGTSELLDRVGDIIEKYTGIKKRIHKAQNSIEVDKNTRVLMFGGNNQVGTFLRWLYDGSKMHLLRKYIKYCTLYNISNSFVA